jgi:hypothetical protein
MDDAADAEEWLRLARRGQLAEAWKASDRIRARSPAASPPSMPRHCQRIWTGEPFDGRRVLIRCYHGLGDTLQFVRYVPAVKQRASHVTVWAQECLLPLIRTIEGCDAAVALHDGAPPVPFDVDAEVMELPYVFRSTLETVPRRVPYVHAAVRRPTAPGLRVGVVWRGGEWDQFRSIPFATLAPLLDDVNVSWFGLQHAPRPSESHPRLRALDSSSVIVTAEWMRGLDLVITIDSMPAHLAGALGVPVWTLLPRHADWRWLEQGATTPWYPTMRLFRQQRAGDWESVIADVQSQLESFRSD